MMVSVITHAERKSRYLLAGKAKDGIAVSVNDTSLHLCKRIPNNYCTTLTCGAMKWNNAFIDR